MRTGRPACQIDMASGSYVENSWGCRTIQLRRILSIVQTQYACITHMLWGSTTSFDEIVESMNQACLANVEVPERPIAAFGNRKRGIS